MMFHIHDTPGFIIMNSSYGKFNRGLRIRHIYQLSSER
jgi:hypothetical protein